LQVTKHLLLPLPAAIGHHLTGLRVQRLPEPSGLFFAANDTPPLLQFSFFNLLKKDYRSGSIARR
jgi:hypothetical protein